MENSLQNIAVGLFAVLSTVMVLIPRKAIIKWLQMDNEVTDKGIDKLGYYRGMFLVSGLATIIIMLFVKYVIL